MESPFFRLRDNSVRFSKSTLPFVFSFKYIEELYMLFICLVNATDKYGILLTWTYSIVFEIQENNTLMAFNYIREVTLVHSKKRTYKIRICSNLGLYTKYNLQSVLEFDEGNSLIESSNYQKVVNGILHAHSLD